MLTEEELARDPGHGGDRGDRHALQRRRLVGGADRRSARPVREDGDRGHRRNRRGLQTGDAGLGHRDGPGPQPEHHRLHPDRPGRHRFSLPAGCRARREARLHGQRAAGVHARQGLCQRRLGGQLRQRHRLRAPHGRGARRRRPDRHGLPRRRLLRHPAALRRLQGDDRGELPQHRDRRGARHRRHRTLPVRPTRSPPRCSRAMPT